MHRPEHCNSVIVANRECGHYRDFLLWYELSDTVHTFIPLAPRHKQVESAPKHQRPAPCFHRSHYAGANFLP